MTEPYFDVGCICDSDSREHVARLKERDIPSIIQMATGVGGKLLGLYIVTDGEEDGHLVLTPQAALALGTQLAIWAITNDEDGDVKNVMGRMQEIVQSKIDESDEETD